MPTPCRSRQANRLYSFLAGVFAMCLGVIAMPHAKAQTIHQLAYNNSTWIDQDLSSQTTDPHTGVAAFVTTPNDQIHTFYLDSAEDVHQLFFNGTSWSDEDLTAEGYGVRAMAKSAVSGFSESNLQYVYYVSQDRHVHQLFYNNVELGRLRHHQPERRSADRQDASINGFGHQQQRLSRVLSGLQQPR